MTESAPFTRLQDLSTALASLVASTKVFRSSLTDQSSRSLGPVDSNGADDRLSALVHINMLNPHELRATAP
jgi:hypothetical protein